MWPSYQCLAAQLFIRLYMSDLPYISIKQILYTGTSIKVDKYGISSRIPTHIFYNRIFKLFLTSEVKQQRALDNTSLLQISPLAWCIQKKWAFCNPRAQGTKWRSYWSRDNLKFENEFLLKGNWYTSSPITHDNRFPRLHLVCTDAKNYLASTLDIQSVVSGSCVHEVRVRWYDEHIMWCMPFHHN